MSIKEKKVFMCGIGGIGMSALAQLLFDQGVEVSGSDREESPTTELLRTYGMQILIGQKKENVPQNSDLFIYTEAIPKDHEERMRADELFIPQKSYFEVLGEVSKEKRTIAVSGTHGKTTTTSMLTKILKDEGHSPTGIIGSITRDFNSNYVKGEDDLFVVEACEYRRDFLTLTPSILIVNNIELDHTDYFKNISDVQDAFRMLMLKTQEAIVTNTHDENISPLLEGLSVPVIDYTKEPHYSISFPGEFNVMNARAAAAAARLIIPNIETASIEKSVHAFKGTWRRFEYKGKTIQGIEVYDDYAHHPTAIRKTLDALREKTKGRIFLAFHPHLFSRTRDLFSDFALALSHADEVLIAPIYSAREIDDGSVSNESLARAVFALGKNARACTFKEIEHILLEEPARGDVIMTMGAGDIYKVANTIITH